jgi:hypothetical protein
MDGELTADGSETGTEYGGASAAAEVIPTPPRIVNTRTTSAPLPPRRPLDLRRALLVISPSKSWTTKGRPRTDRSG